MNLSDFTIDELKYAINYYGSNDVGILLKSIQIDSLDEANKRINELFLYKRDQIIDEFRNREKAIYGIDERHDLYQISDPKITEISSGICAIVDTNALSNNRNGTTSLHGKSYKDRFNLCPSEKFINQLSIATGTAFLIDNSMVVTAAHCIDENNIFRYKFVFDFETTPDGSTRTIIEDSNIYSGTRIIGRRFEPSSGIDWAVVQLDRPVLDKNILKLDLTNTISVGDSVYCIGHPSGLPKKVAINGIVKEQHKNHFVANVDTYAGNSGSPVINSQTHLVEGILVRGEVDFLNTGNCYVSNRCMSNNCRGEDVFKPNDFSHLIPNQTTPGFEFDNSKVRIEGSTIILKEGEILNYTGKENSLHKAYDIIKYYNFNFKGDVNCGGKYLSYYLSNGQAPQGNFPSGEDKIPFNRKEIEIRMHGSRWKLMEPNHLILDFEENQEKARHALSIILKHEFNYICFVGRPHSPLIYFKK